TGTPRRRRRRRSCRTPPTTESRTPSASTETDTPRPPTAVSAHRRAERSDPPIDTSASRDPAAELHSRPSPPPWPEQPEATTDTHEGSPQKRRSLALSAPRPSGRAQIQPPSV